MKQVWTWNNIVSQENITTSRQVKMNCVCIDDGVAVWSIECCVDKIA